MVLLLFMSLRCHVWHCCVIHVFVLRFVSLWCFCVGVVVVFVDAAVVAVVAGPGGSGAKACWA